MSKRKSLDSFYFKTPRNERFSEMTKQEQLIAQKKLEIQAKLEEKKRVEAQEALKKLSNSPVKPKPPLNFGFRKTNKAEPPKPAGPAVGSNNIFSNDGSFLEQFKKLVNKNSGKEKDNAENVSEEKETLPEKAETCNAKQNVSANQDYASRDNAPKDSVSRDNSNHSFNHSDDQNSKRMMDQNKRYDDFRRNDNRRNDNRRNDNRNIDNRNNDNRNIDNRKFDHNDRRRRFENERHDNRNRRFERDRGRYDNERERYDNERERYDNERERERYDNERERERERCYDDYDRSRRYDRYEPQKNYNNSNSNNYYDDNDHSRRSSWETHNQSSLNDSKYSCSTPMERNERNIPPWESNSLLNQQQQQSLANSSVLQYQPAMTVPVSSIILSSTVPVPVSITTYVSSLPVTLPTDSVTYPSVQIPSDTTVPVLTQQIPLQQHTPGLILQPINQQVSLNQSSSVASIAFSQTPTLTHVPQPTTLITVPQCSISSLPQSSTLNPVPPPVLSSGAPLNSLPMQTGNAVLQQCQSTIMSQTSVPPPVSLLPSASMQVQQMPNSTSILSHSVPPPTSLNPHSMNPHPVPPPSSLNHPGLPPSSVTNHSVLPPSPMNTHSVPPPSSITLTVPSQPTLSMPPQSGINPLSLQSQSLSLQTQSLPPQPVMTPHSIPPPMNPQSSMNSIIATSGAPTSGPPPVAYPCLAASVPAMPTVASQSSIPASAQNSLQASGPPPVQLAMQPVFNQQTISTPVPDMSVPPPLVVPNNKPPKMNDGLNSGAHRSAEMEQVAVIVAQQGDGMEDILLQDNPHDPKLWFLRQKQSYAYLEFRQLVDKLRSNPLNSNPIKVEQPEYEESEEYSGIVFKRDMKLENKMKREAEDIKQETSGNRKKRRSRWAPEDCKVEIPAPSVAPPLLPLGAVPPPTINPQINTKNLPGVSGPMISQIVRNDPALLQYAIQSFGTTNLSEEDWAKCEDHYKINLLYQDMLRKREEIERLQAAGKFKYEYDSDEETEGGTWEHKLRKEEMYATQLWADELTEKAKGKHHIGDFLPPDELERFMEKYSALKEGREPDLSDYKEFKLKEDNLGFQMLQKLGWSEGSGLGSDGKGIIDPVNKAATRVDNQGLGVERPAEVSRGDDEYDAYRKRMMLAYRFRPNPLNNPRRPYY